MATIDLIRRLHAHRDWVNRQLLECAEELDESQRQQLHAIGQGSVAKTLSHLFAAEFVWLEALRGNEQPLAPGDAVGKLPGNQEGEDPAKSLSDLRTRWSSLDGQWRQHLNEMTDASLDEVIYKRDSRTGQRFRYRRSDIHLHVCLHAQYTTAQLINMLRQMGVTSLPLSMLISLVREDANELKPGDDNEAIPKSTNAVPRCQGPDDKPLPCVTVTGYMIVPDTDLSAVRESLAEHVRLTQAEPGCMEFRVSESVQQPGRFDVYERFVDRVAFDAHQRRVRESAWGEVSRNATRRYDVRDQA